MEILILVGVLVVLFVIGGVMKGSTSSSASSHSTQPVPHRTKSQATRPAASRGSSKAKDDEGWLMERWKAAARQLESGVDEGLFPEWYFDEATDKQLDLLDELGVTYDREIMSKGQASDLIGMHYEPDSDELAILKFFNIRARGWKQTRVRHEVAKLLQEPENVQAWEARPPSAEQKEYMKFFGLKVSKGMTHAEAGKIIGLHQKGIDEDDPRWEAWEAYEEILDELSDSDNCELYDIKKPSVTLIKQAIVALQKDGKTYRDIADDIDGLAEKLLELKPELQRR